MKEISFEEVLEEKGFFLWKTQGISMRPLIVQGRDYVHIRAKKEPLKKYDAVLYLRRSPSGKVTYNLHRIIRKNPDGTYWIVGDNCDYGEDVAEDDIIGVLAAVFRKGKRITADDWRYRLYVHLWCSAYPIRFFTMRFLSYSKRAVKKLLRLAGIIEQGR